MTMAELAVIKERPILFSGEMVVAILDGKKTQTRRIVKKHLAPCPYGGIGERLWVRETFAAFEETLADVRLSGVTSKEALENLICYQDNPEFNLLEDGLWRKHPSIHMPRWVSRILLEVVNSRVEPLNRINHADAIAEGVTSVDEYSALWDKLNGDKPGCGWDNNPYVWVVEFKNLVPK
jgi:hypothetical protein